MSLFHRSHPIIIADREAGIAETTGIALEKHCEVRVVGHTRSGEEAVELAQKHKPRALVLELDLDGLIAHEVILQLRRRMEKPPGIFILTGKTKVEIIHRAITAEPNAVVLKKEPLDFWIPGMKAALEDGHYLSRGARQCCHEARNGRPDSVAGIPEAIKEVILALIQGKTDKEIATLRGTREGTVRKQHEEAYRLTGCHNLAQLHEWGRRRGWLP